MVTITTDKDSYSKDELVYVTFHAVSVEPGGIVLASVYGETGSGPIIAKHVEIDPTTLIGKWTISNQVFTSGTNYLIQGIYDPEPIGTKKIQHIQYP